MTERFYTSLKWQSEMRSELDRFARERKELTEQVQDVESQLEWLRAEKYDEIAKLVAERKNLQDRLHDAETQLNQLRSRKRDELKVGLAVTLDTPSGCLDPSFAKWFLWSTPRTPVFTYIYSRVDHFHLHIICIFRKV